MVLVIGVTQVGTVVTVVVGRFLGGVCLGINMSTIPVYIQQLSPLTISGAIGTMF